MYRTLKLSVWKPTGYKAHFTFTKKPSKDDLGAKFLKYILTMNKIGTPATRRGFLRWAGYGAAAESHGYLSSFFSAARQAGLVRVIMRSRLGYHYNIGDNCEAYLAGKLCCLVKGWQVGYYHPTHKMPDKVLILGEELRNKGLF